MFNVQHLKCYATENGFQYFWGMELRLIGKQIFVSGQFFLNKKAKKDNNYKHLKVLCHLFTLFKTLFWLLQPTFVDLRANKLYYLPYFLVKLVPNMWILMESIILMEHHYAWLELDRLAPFTILHILLMAGINGLYLAYLVHPAWFFVPSEEDDPRDPYDRSGDIDGEVKKLRCNGFS